MTASYRARLADADSASWLAGTCGVGVWTKDDVHYVLDMPLPELPADSLIVPSLSLPGADTSWHAELVSSAGTLALPGVPHGQGAPLNGSNPDASGQIDCFVSHRVLNGAAVRYVVRTDAPPERFLAVTSARNQTSVRVSTPHATSVPAPAAIHSQRLFGAQLADRTCAPVSTAMALGGIGVPAEPADVIRESRHPTANIYGVWPMAVYAAGQRGVLAAVESCIDFKPVVAALAAGTSVVASIRFEAGELAGAPLPETTGHLVTIVGIDDTDVIVHDPAALTLDTVRRRYDRAEFAHAWLSKRGVGIFFFVPSER